jgi:hypothetical protein
MFRYNGLFVLILIFSSLLMTGCVERKLTINTEPQGAIVTLNDEEIGVSPVTVGFQWYGDYDIRITKPGYETLKTNRMLKAPLHDKFPLDFIAQCLNPKRIVDEYEWTFTLEEKTPVDKDQLIKDAQNLKEQL